MSEPFDWPKQLLGPLGGLLSFIFVTGIGAGWNLCVRFIVKMWKDRFEEQGRRVAALEDEKRAHERDMLDEIAVLRRDYRDGVQRELDQMRQSSRREIARWRGGKDAEE